MPGESAIGESPIGSVPEAIGVPIIPEVTETLKELILTVELDMIRSQQAA